MMNLNVLVVDSPNLAFRNYYAQNLKTSSGQNTGMIYGFINSMLSVIRDIKPDVILYVWDPPGGSVYRKSRYGLYKANREQKGPEFTEELDLLKQILTNLGTRQITVPEVEADDVIGYLAKDYYKDHLVTILSNDKDLYQLINESTRLYAPDKGYIVVDESGKISIKEQSKVISIRPDQVPDYKALAGDTSDNYPGIPGFGIGAAISYFATNERAIQIVEGTADLRSLRSNVLNSIIQNRHMVSLWLDLATIHPELVSGLKIPAKSTSSTSFVSTIFEQLEFKQFLALGDIVYRIGGQ